MADWGEIIGTGLVGGLVGYADSKAASIMDEEAQARQDGLLRLKREWQIDDREWKSRMDDKNWQRQEQRDDKIWDRQQQLADTTFNRERGLLEDERAYQASLPGDIESKAAQLKKLGFSDEEIKAAIFGAGKREGGLTEYQEYQIDEKKQERVYKYYTDIAEGYNKYLENTVDNPPLSREEWAYQNNRPAWEAVIAPEIQEKVTQLVKNGNPQGLAEYQKSLGPGNNYSFVKQIADSLITREKAFNPQLPRTSKDEPIGPTSSTGKIDFEGGRERARAASERYRENKLAAEREAERKARLAEEMRAKRSSERNKSYATRN